MKTKPLKQPGMKASPAGIGLPTRKQVHTRAREPVPIAGHGAQADYVQARREPTGESDVDPQDAVLDALPESKRWDPVPGSIGHQAPESPSEDEDDEGRNESAQLVDQGVNAAANGQILQSAQPAVNERSGPIDNFPSVPAVLRNGPSPKAKPARNRKPRGEERKSP